jgi:hypothetical protein
MIVGVKGPPLLVVVVKKAMAYSLLLAFSSVFGCDVRGDLWSQKGLLLHVALTVLSDIADSKK